MRQEGLRKFVDFGFLAFILPSKHTILQKPAL